MGDNTVTVCGTTRPGTGTIAKLPSGKDQKTARALIDQIDAAEIYREKNMTLWSKDGYRIDYQGSFDDNAQNELKQIALQNDIMRSTRRSTSSTFAQVHVPSEWSKETTSADVQEGMRMSLEEGAIVEIEYKYKEKSEQSVRGNKRERSSHSGDQRTRKVSKSELKRSTTPVEGKTVEFRSFEKR